jgi:membrane-associated phospholipid phosphatase
LRRKIWAPGFLAAALTLSFTLARADPGTVPSSDPSAGPTDSRPAHLWTADYADLLWNDTGAILTAPARWNEDDWTTAGLAAAAIGGAAAFDKTIKDHVQAHRTSGEDRFMKQFQNLGSTWSFGVLAGFEVWGEVGGDNAAKAVALDGLTASIVGPGLIGTSVKYAVGRVRPNTATRTFELKPFGGNQSFPSGHAAQAFAVATTIAEHYPAWWVQGLCYGSAAAVGFARIEQNAHFASDVVAGSILGWSVARAIVHRHDGPPKENKLTWTPYASGAGVGLLFYRSF